MSIENIIAYISLVVVMIVLIQCFRHGFDSGWGLVLKILFFPITLILLVRGFCIKNGSRQNETVEIIGFNYEGNAMYKIETFIPKDFLQSLRQALLEVDAGHIGNYRGCLSYFPVTGVWFSEEGSNPTIGQQGQWSEEPELKVEVNVEDANKDKTVEAIRRVHPYEEPVINAIRLD